MAACAAIRILETKKDDWRHSHFFVLFRVGTSPLMSMMDELLEGYVIEPVVVDGCQGVVCPNSLASSRPS
jgi:hypothetical protein